MKNNKSRLNFDLVIDYIRDRCSDNSASARRELNKMRKLLVRGDMIAPKPRRPRRPSILTAERAEELRLKALAANNAKSVALQVEVLGNHVREAISRGYGLVHYDGLYPETVAEFRARGFTLERYDKGQWCVCWGSQKPEPFTGESAPL